MQGRWKNDNDDEGCQEVKREVGKMKPKLINIKVETNIREILEKVERLETLFNEANSIVEDLTSEGLEVNVYI